MLWDVVFYNVLINGLLKVGRVGVDWVYKGMREKGIELDVVIFNIMMSLL